MKEKRVVKRKNYVIVSILFLVTIILTFYWMAWYQATLRQQNSTSALLSFAPELKKEEISSYMMENSHAVFYFASASSQDKKVQEFEKELKNQLSRLNLKSHLVFVNTDFINDRNYYKILANDYFSANLKERNISFVTTPNLLMVSEGNIIDILYKEAIAIQKEDIRQFLEVYQEMIS